MNEDIYTSFHSDEFIKPLIDVNKRITWKQVKEFLDNKDEKFLSKNVTAFDTITDEEIPVLGFFDEHLIVNY